MNLCTQSPSSCKAIVKEILRNSGYNDRSSAAKPFIITKHFKFHKRNQASTETVSQYLAELLRGGLAQLFHMQPPQRSYSKNAS